jgi:hypothetical protein
LGKFEKKARERLEFWKQYLMDEIMRAQKTRSSPKMKPRTLY